MSRVLAGLAVALSVLSVLLVLLAAAAPAAQEGIIFSLPAPGGGPGMPPPQAPARDNQQKTGTAGIRGRVVAADTGQPLRRAQVRAMAPELRENRGTTTDTEGRYELKELPAGRYTLTASKGSYLALQYGQTRPFEAGKAIEILDNQIVEKVDFSLPPGSVVTGRVVDEFGEPLADVQVAAMRYRVVQGRRQLVPAGRVAMTNDIGEFRLFALPPGQYYVSGTLRSMMGLMAESDDRTGYAPTYYPGTSNIAEAQRVTLDVGEMLTGLTLTLTPTGTARVSGTAVDSSGRPFVGAMVMVVPRERAGMMMMTTGPNQVKADGSFVVSGLAPGDYVFQVMTPGLPGQNSEFATADVTVSGSDIDGVRLVGTRPATISGRIVIEPAAAQSLQPAAMRVALVPASFDSPMLPMMGGMGGAVKDDFTFEISARPGKWRIISAGGPAGWALKLVRSDGIDVTDDGIEVRANENVENVEIELTNVLSNVSGLVTNSRGDLATNYSLVVFARDRDRWTPGSRYLRSARPDQDGRFKLTGLPAADYYVVALDYIEQGAETDPETLERLESKAATFSLDDGETKALDLKLNSID